MGKIIITAYWGTTKTYYDCLFYMSNYEFPTVINKKNIVCNARQRWRQK